MQYRPDHNAGIRGIAILMLGILSAVLMDTCAKWLSSAYPVGEIAFFRCTFALIPLGILAFHTDRAGFLSSRPNKLHAIRAALMIGGTLTFFCGLKYLSFGEATAIFFVEPLLVIALSAVFLREKFDAPKLAAASAGFLGVVAIIQPGHDAMSFMALYPLAAALLSAIWMIVSSSAPGSDDPSVSSFFTTVFAAGIAVVMLPFGWVLPSGRDLAIFLLVGLFGGLSTLFYTSAFRYAPASTLAPFDYMSIAFATLFGFLIWGETLNSHSAFGICCVILSGLFVIWYKREQAPPSLALAND